MKLPILAATLIAMSSCNSSSVDTKKEAEKLMQTSRDWAAIGATGSKEKALSYWTDDAVVMSAYQPPVVGKKQIRDMVDGSFKDPGFKISWEPRTASVSKSGDMGYLIEDGVMSFTDPSTGKIITNHYKAVTIWKKQPDGTWKNVVDVSGLKTNE
jgi:ketosteroid isomerase-like protein